jgi:hypothetical protein
MKLILPALALVTGCITADLDPETSTDPVARYVDPGDPTCPYWGCGANSATVGDGLIFDELDSSGVSPNRGGLYLVGAKLASGTPVKVRVYRHWLYAVDGTGEQYWDSQLDNMIITLKHPTYGVYEVLVVATHTQPGTLKFWVGDADVVPNYELRTRKLGESKFVQFACRSELTGDPGWNSEVHRAIVFQWDRYDAESKKVRETATDDPWFNLACAGTAPAKMHLMRHTRAGAANAYGAEPYLTPVAQRQALLKMFTADYCGNGHTFTVDGTPLSYQDRNHWKSVLGAVDTEESLWKDGGATCLSTPRYVSRALVESVCGHTLPSCGTVTAGWESSAYEHSANPYPVVP